jgi:hypothetical protein
VKPILNKLVVLALCFAPSAYAASGAEHEGTGIFFWLFIGFAAMVIAFQFIPGLMMFLGMIKGLFEPGTKGSATAQDPGEK